MDKFNLESAKFVSIIIGICFIFIMVIWHAFDYLPKNDTSISGAVDIEQISKIEDTTAMNSEEKVVMEKKTTEPVIIQSPNKETPKQDVVVEQQYKAEEIKPLEPLETIDMSDVTSEKSLQLKEFFDNAENYKRNNQLVSAVNEYQKALSVAEDAETKAQCYEEIALIYANIKRYGSALSAAQKAFNMSPSTPREVLLARLYYKTGDIDKASKRIDNVLKRNSF